MADADPDTWSLPSQARPAPLDTLDAEGARAASPAESVRRLYSKLDEELLRGRFRRIFFRVNGNCHVSGNALDGLVSVYNKCIIAI